MIYNLILLFFLTVTLLKPFTHGIEKIAGFSKILAQDRWMKFKI